MAKRTTAFAFLLLASILFLAHAVVPHHHHNGGQVCLINDHCVSDNLYDGSGEDEKTHRHDGGDSSDNCVLKVPVALPSEPGNSDIHFTDNSSNDSDHHGLYMAILNNTSLKIPVVSLFAFAQPGDHSYRSLVSASQGLRAPPSV